MSFYQNVRFDAYLAGTQTEERDGDNLSYRGFFDYNADRYGVQAERLVVEPNFLPEIGFLRRTDMRRNFGLVRYSPRPTNVPHVRKLTSQASLNYLTNNQNRLDTRELERDVSNRVHQQRRRQRRLHRQLRAPGPAVRVSTGVNMPVGTYDFHTLQMSATPADSSARLRARSCSRWGRSTTAIARRSPSTPRECR